MRLDEITQWESALKAKMPHRASMEQRDKYLEEQGFYQEWGGVFKEYAKLALKGDLEALKRCVFFIWYEAAEPVPLHGIWGLDQTLSEKVLGRLNTMCAQGDLDTELRWMLPYYYSVCDFYLDRFSGLDDLLKVSRRNVKLWYKLARKSSFSDRGQLGDYWSAISLQGPSLLRYRWYRAFLWLKMKLGREKEFDPVTEMMSDLRKRMDSN